MGNCLQQPGQLSNQLHKSTRSGLIQLIKFSVPWLILLPWQCQSGCWPTHSCHGFCIAIWTILSWRDNFVPFIGTQPSGQLYRDTKILPTYRDCAKTHANPDTDGNSPYHRAVNNNTGSHLDIRLPALQIILFTVTRYFFAVHQICTATLYCSFFRFISSDNSCNLDNFLRQPHNPADAHIKNWLPATFC